MMAAYQQLKIFSGTANPELSQKIAATIGVSLGEIQIRRFADGEVFIEIDENVRGMDVFVIQPTCPPANENLMELLILIDTLKRASADRITAVIPYYGYARQDRKVLPRTPITSKLIADLLTAAGANRILALDLHAGQIQGFFNIPFDHLYATPIFLEVLEKTKGPEVTMVSPDAGGTERARAYAKRLNVDLAVIDKRRTGPNQSEVMHLIGDVEGKDAVIVDDIVDTAGTLVQAAEAIMKKGKARSVIAVCTHAVLSGGAVGKVSDSPLKRLIIADTIPLGEEARRCGKIQVLSVAGLLAEAIRRIHTGESVSSLFV